MTLGTRYKYVQEIFLSDLHNTQKKTRTINMIFQHCWNTNSTCDSAIPPQRSNFRCQLEDTSWNKKKYIPFNFFNFQSIKLQKNTFHNKYSSFVFEISKINNPSVN
jgi:hypothetical protein